MKKKTFAFLVAVLTFLIGVAIAKFSLPDFRSSDTVPELEVSNYRLTGPYQHENLTIFLIHGRDQPDSLMFTPLEEAMERGIVTVHETNDVNELAIENLSISEEVLVQAGDIVKGGRQDRVLAVDIILPTTSGKVPIDAFCVERARWSPRGAESAVNFSVSLGMISSKQLKIATRTELSQARVWDEVAETQQKLSDAVARDVRSNASASSLQLALENKQVQESAAKYVEQLVTIVEGSNDVIGFAFAVNNKLNSADVYLSSPLFKRFWPRLLKTAALEAVAERTLNETNEQISIASVGEFLTASEKGLETITDVTTHTRMLKRQSEKALFFETRYMLHGGAWVHRSYLTR